MTTIFEQAAAQTSAAVDAIYGESFQFVAMTTTTDVDGPRQPDASRPTFTAVAGWLGPTKTQYPRARGSVPEDSAPNKVAASVPRISVDTRNLLWPVTTGDRVVRLKNGDTFEVSRPLPDGVLRLVLHLTARKRVIPARALRFNAAANSGYLVLI